MLNVRGVAVSVRRADWAKRIQDRNSSGLTIKAYCESEGIPAYSYYYYLKKLRETACDVLVSTQDQTMNMAQPVFAELKIPTQPAFTPSKCGNLANQICIETAGVRLTADGEYSVDKLAELLRVVSRECC